MKTHRNDEELTQAAVEYARQHGRNPQDYTVSSVNAEGEKTRITFQGKSGRPGDHFSVVMDSNTGQAISIVLGR